MILYKQCCGEYELMDICFWCSYLQPGTTCSTWRMRRGPSRRTTCEGKYKRMTRRFFIHLQWKRKNPQVGRNLLYYCMDHDYTLLVRHKSPTTPQPGRPIFRDYSGGDGHWQVSELLCGFCKPSMPPCLLPVYNNSAVVSYRCQDHVCRHSLVWAHTSTVM